MNGILEVQAMKLGQTYLVDGVSDCSTIAKCDVNFC